ncbi:helix-turn-helix domain-containing protein [Algoriphagus namhaensis]
MLGLLIFNIVVLSGGVINSLLLMVKESKGLVKNYFLGGSLFCYVIFFLVFILWYQLGLIKLFPHLLRSASPVMFLAGPFFYFFVRNTLAGNYGLQRWDWLHFIPALAHVVDLLPVFLMSSAEKSMLTEQVLSNPYQVDFIAQGFVDSFWVHSFRLVQMGAYFGLGTWLLIRNQKLNFRHPWLTNWLTLVIVLMTGVHVGYFGFVITFFVAHWAEMDLSIIQIAFFYLILFCIGLLGLYIHVRPERVFAINTVESEITKQSNEQVSEHEGEGANASAVSSKEYQEEPSVFEPDERVCGELTRLFDQEEIFRKKDLLVGTLAKRLEISVRELPHYFRHYFDSDFKKYVNEKRVELAKQKIEEGYLESFTLEALGEHCGFSSRTTFFNNFKKKYGVSPSEYRNNFTRNNW